MKPGFFAFDMAAHRGASSKDQFCETLTGTDVYSGRTEELAPLIAANRWVQDAIPDSENALLFPL